MMERGVSDSQPTTLRLNRGQKRDLQLSLSIAKRAMRLLEALLVLEWVERTDRDDTDRQREFDLEPGADELRALSREFRDQVAAILDDLGLQKDERQLQGLLVAQIRHASDAIDGSLVSELAGYGPVDPDTEAYLRLRLAGLAILAREMMRAVGRVAPSAI